MIKIAFLRLLHAFIAGSILLHAEAVAADDKLSTAQCNVVIDGVNIPFPDCHLARSTISGLPEVIYVRSSPDPRDWLQIDTGGGDSYWNGGNWTTKGTVSLGVLTDSGGCWKNPRVSVCLSDIKPTELQSLWGETTEFRGIALGQSRDHVEYGLQRLGYRCLSEMELTNGSADGKMFDPSQAHKELCVIRKGVAREFEGDMEDGQKALLMLSFLQGFHMSISFTEGFAATLSFSPDFFNAADLSPQRFGDAIVENYGVRGFDLVNDTWVGTTAANEKVTIEFVSPTQVRRMLVEFSGASPTFD